jgi:hypothetical protein
MALSLHLPENLRKKEKSDCRNILQNQKKINMQAAIPYSNCDKHLFFFSHEIGVMRDIGIFFEKCS